MTPQRLIFGAEGQSLVFDAPETQRLGRPTAVASVTVFDAERSDDGTAEQATTGSPSVEGVAIELAGPAGFGRPDRRLLSFADTEGLEPGRTYVLDRGDGGREEVDLIEVGADYAVTRHPLFGSYPAGAELVSPRISVAVANAWATDKRKLSDSIAHPRYRVRWVYTIGGGPAAHDSYLDLVRYAPGHRVSSLDVERLVPGFLDNLPTHHREDQGASLIDEAYEQVSIDLHQEEKADHAARSPRVIAELVKRKAVMLWIESRVYSGGAGLDALEAAARGYQSRFDQLVRVKNRTKFDASGSGAAKPAPPIPLARR